MRYTREDGCRAWLTYALMHADTLSELLSEFGTAEAIYDRFMEKGSSFLKARVSEFGLTQLSLQSQRDRMHDMLVRMKSLDIGILGQQDDGYPDSLRNIPSPPALLYFRGNPDCLMGKCIAVVGSRKASLQGTDVTRKICRELSAAGVAVVSGLAMGIDAAAHEGCLEGGSSTAAVLGCGLDVDYPMENLSLRDHILENDGVLLSEYPLGFRANKYVFQVRNRIISGLGKAVLMMESRIQSGSMLTVQHALDQGKEVFAYPGIPGTEWAEGAHQLLREGANYFTSAQDILEDLGWDDDLPRPTSQQVRELPEMSADQRSVFALLSGCEMSFDQLAAQTGLSAPSLTIALTMLQMTGLVKPLPGKCYCRA